MATSLNFAQELNRNKMNKLNWFLLAVIAALCALIYFHRCDCPPAESMPPQRVEVIEKQVHRYEYQVKERAPKIQAVKEAVKKRRAMPVPVPDRSGGLPVAGPDSLVQTGSALADSVCREKDITMAMLDTIILLQDSTIADQARVIALRGDQVAAVEQEAAQLRKDIRKARRRLFWTKVGAVTAVAGSALVFVNPATGAAVIIAGAAVVVISNTGKRKLDPG